MAWERKYNNPTIMGTAYTCEVSKPAGYKPTPNFPNARMTGTIGQPDETYHLEYMVSPDGPGPNLWNLGPKYAGGNPRQPAVKVTDTTPAPDVIHTHDKPQIRDGAGGGAEGSQVTIDMRDAILTIRIKALDLPGGGFVPPKPADKGAAVRKAKRK